MKLDSMGIRFSELSLAWKAKLYVFINIKEIECDCIFSFSLGKAKMLLSNIAEIRMERNCISSWRWLISLLTYFIPK